MAYHILPPILDVNSFLQRNLRCPFIYEGNGQGGEHPARTSLSCVPSGFYIHLCPTKEMIVMTRASRKRAKKKIFQKL